MPAARPDVGELLGADEQVVAVMQVHDAQERCSGDVAGEAADDSRLEIDREGVAEALRHESDFAPVRGKVGAFAEMRQHLDVGGEMIERVPLFLLGEAAARGEQHERETLHLDPPRNSPILPPLRGGGIPIAEDDPLGLRAIDPVAKSPGPLPPRQSILGSGRRKQPELHQDRLIIPRRDWTTFGEMAVRLGTVRDVLSRALKTLEGEGLLKVEKHQIVVLDPQALERRGSL